MPERKGGRGRCDGMAHVLRDGERTRRDDLGVKMEGVGMTIKCSSCGFDNQEAMVFCGKCAAPLLPVCQGVAVGIGANGAVQGD